MLKASAAVESTKQITECESLLHHIWVIPCSALRLKIVHSCWDFSSFSSTLPDKFWNVPQATSVPACSFTVCPHILLHDASATHSEKLFLWISLTYTIFVEKKSWLGLTRVTKQNEKQFACLNKMTDLWTPPFSAVVYSCCCVRKSITSMCSSNFCDLQVLQLLNTPLPPFVSVVHNV